MTPGGIKDLQSSCFFNKLFGCFAVVGSFPPQESSEPAAREDITLRGNKNLLMIYRAALNGYVNHKVVLTSEYSILQPS